MHKHKILYWVMLLPYFIRGQVDTRTINSTKTIINNEKENVQCGDWDVYESSCYRFFSSFEYFETASQMCKLSNADLVTIKNEEENDYVRSLVAKNTEAINKETWIGFKRINNTFQWINNGDRTFTNWFINRPTSVGDCVQMIPGGLWMNILCYNQMQFVCKKTPEIIPNNSRLYLIIQISIPVSCVCIMFLFITFLCIKSHKELNELKQHTNDANPFQLVQAAMELPSSSDIFNKQSTNGIDLWQRALEKIKKEQSLQKTKDQNNNQDQSNRSSQQNGFALIVQSVMRRRSEALIAGTLGAPSVIVSHVDDDKRNEESALIKFRNLAKKRTIDNVKIINDLPKKSSIKNSNSNSNRDIEKRTMRTKQNEQLSFIGKSTINQGYNHSTEKVDVASPTLSFKSEIGIWLKNHPRSPFKIKPELQSVRKKNELSLCGRSSAIDLQDPDDNSDDTAASNGIYEKRGKKQGNNLVEVVVDINTDKRNSSERVNSLENNNEQTSPSHFLTRAYYYSVTPTHRQKDLFAPQKTLGQIVDSNEISHYTSIAQTEHITEDIPEKYAPSSRRETRDSHVVEGTEPLRSRTSRSSELREINIQDKFEENGNKDSPITILKFINYSYLKSTLV